jgi:hypothetical protein
LAAVSSKEPLSGFSHLSRRPFLLLALLWPSIFGRVSPNAVHDIGLSYVGCSPEQVFLAASTECSAGSNDYFVVGVGAGWVLGGWGGGSIFSPVRWKATRWR